MTKKQNDKKKNDGKMVVSHNIAEEEKSNNRNSKNKRKRLSKTERKALKKQKKQKRCHEEEEQQDQGNNEKHHEEEQKGQEHQQNQSHDLNCSKLSDKEIDNSNNDDDKKNRTEDEDEDESWMMESYKSIPVPLKPSKEVINSCNSKSKQQQNQKNDDIDEGGGGGGGSSKTTLGKWFPNALLMKCPVNYSNTGKLLLLNNCNNDNESSRLLLSESDVKVDNPKASLVLFYQYTPKKWTSTQLQLLMTYLQQIVKSRRHIGGRIRIAQEGVNATISSVDCPEYTSKELLRHFAEDLRQFDPITFGQTDFKYIDDLPPDRHFKELKIIPVQELVFYDIASTEAPLDLEQGGTSKKENDTTLGTTTTATKVDGIRGGIHLDAKEYHEMLKKDNTVVIDVRNHYETIIGRFDGQQKQQNQETSSSTVVVSASSKKSKNKKKQGESEASSSSTTAAEVVAKKKPEESTTTNTTGENSNGNGTRGAEYLDPLMRKSTDFKSWLANEETKSKLHNKTVLMYCTGGIRCERASAYLKKEMGNQVDGVYQLQGGIERYLKAFPDGGFWRGKNFVFDKREAVSIHNPDGDGGVIRKKKAKNSKSNNDNDDKELPSSKCVVCGVSWDRYVGKKKCYTCGVPVLMCDKCMSLKPDKTPGMKLKVRCPLCVEENITKPACEVDWTANGMKTTISSTTTSSNSSKPVATAAAATDATTAKAANATTNKKKKGGDENRATSNAKKAAGSVLKWGGGHASNKKLGRKVKGRMCRFGVDCVRKDCIFVHPPGWK